MNNAELYKEIPFMMLERVGFPNNYIQLSLEQRQFIDLIFDETAKVYASNLKMQDQICVLEDKVADLNDIIAKLEYRK